MKLEGLELKNYRNCADLKLDLNSAKILIIGKNAQGKTNILESIYFLSALKSPRTSNHTELINFQAEKFEIDAKIIKADTDITLSCSYNKEKFRELKINGLKSRPKDFKPIYVFKEDIKKGKLTDYLMASCYLPIFKMEKLIDDNYYLDGGFYDYAPANALINRGYDKVYVVDLDAIGFRRKYKDKDKVIVIKPSRKLGSIININESRVRENILMGYYDTLKIVKNLDGYKYIFKNKSDSYYRFLIRKVSKKKLKEMQKFFRTINEKKLVLKALEYVMDKENFSYYEVYSPMKIIRKIKKIDKNYGVYNFVKKMQFL